MSENPRVLGNRYEVGDLLGRGGMAEVHLGRDARLGRAVAIKLLRTDLARDPVFQARFRREAQSAAALNHPAIVAVYDTGEEQVMEAGGSLVALPYIVMEYVQGRTLRDLLREGHTVPPHLAARYTSGVLSALDYSHRAGIVHRDIKPANVMLTPSGEVKVMDFGIARALADASATMTQTQAVIGTAQYLSPEQARGETVDARSDLYSAGCLLFELLTGRPPFVADSPVAVAYQHVREAPPLPSSLNPAISPDLERVVLHALAKDREDRYQSAAAFRDDLENVLSGRPVQAPVAAFAATAPLPAAPTERIGYASSGSTRAYPAAEMPPPPTAQTTRAAQRPQRSGRGVGYVLLGVLVVAVFAAVAYLAYTMLGGGTKTVEVPTVTGLSQAQAKAELRARGLEASVTTKTSDNVPADTVLGQDPPAGRRVATGSAVTLTVSSGTATTQVPDVNGLTVEQATAQLEAAGLTVAGTKTVDNADLEKDRVIGTDPKATMALARGTGVTLIISSGQVEIPEVVGKSITDALTTLNKLRIGVNQEQEPSDQAEGTVLSQSIPAKQKVDPRTTTITLRVAVPKGSTPEPTTPAPTDTAPAPTETTPPPTTPAPTNS